MNWVTTNIRLPEDLYRELKMQAAQSRKSMAALIREKITTKKSTAVASTLLEEFDELGREITKQTKGKNLTATLLKSRYSHI
ncbi:hypothetical protein A2Z00_01945 [Candidatus Gottesmanbacteria bacterium RBG_13_45_10]|uniref:Ribbon-helix-helix protein CopG domain-containing protein n=1 Tax=Candidatus Gottesmanbacteria bacterium RBG_13_45_10 TaxID=1798370 RepID=A0A1F5ZH15_9BACT|nr:MAG: hypothetical protein A2Z00_01945 [Candidatus Gottesmanbacteria bacterium RBG_13_45_10]